MASQISKTVKLTYRCTECEHENERLVPSYEPEEFSARGSGSILVQCWCRSCKSPQVFRYGFYRDQEGTVQVQVIKHFEPTSVFMGQKTGTGITVRPRSGRPKKG